MVNLGVIDEKRGDLDAAAARFQQAIRQQPNYAEAHNNLGHVRQRQGDLVAATACYRQAGGAQGLLPRGAQQSGRRLGAARPVRGGHRGLSASA